MMFKRNVYIVFYPFLLILLSKRQKPAVSEQIRNPKVINRGWKVANWSKLAKTWTKLVYNKKVGLKWPTWLSMTNLVRIGCYPPPIARASNHPCVYALTQWKWGLEKIFIYKYIYIYIQGWFEARAIGGGTDRFNRFGPSWSFKTNLFIFDQLFC